MPRKALIHVTILSLATLITYLWVTDKTLAHYSLQLTGILMLSFIISLHLHRPSQFRLVESVVSTMAVLLICTATGGINSPLFFLNHFLLFELSLLLTPIVPIFLSFILITFYLFAYQIGTHTNLLPLLSFPFLTPLAYIFGKLYQKSKNQHKELRNLNQKIVSLEDELVVNEL